ncbi:MULTISPECIES: hypothetical protein [unclassified Microbacterium]|uniref:hypothetical protein n=1 Tax=unclassified Microbacterium TaxID=2609290 RepID=UPI0025DB4D30|nr:MULTISPECIES: hypothetical protein [unclassified Microbacterium]
MTSVSARWGAGLAVAVLTLSVAGCSFGNVAKTGAEQVVSTFFQRLIEGDAQGAGALLSDPSVVSPVALDDDVYADAVRPVDARVTSVTGSDSAASVTVEYRLDGDDEPRTLTVSTTTVGGEARVEQWADLGLYFDGQGIPGDIAIEESGVFDLATTEALRLLPGVYELDYPGEQGLTTIDPDGGEGEPFAVEYPVDPEMIQPPPGAEMLSKILILHPVLRADAAVDIEAGIDDLLASCTASGLVGDDCPSIVADGVANEGYRGTVDGGSVVWNRQEPLALAAGQEVRVSAPYAVSFGRPSGPQEETVDVEGTVRRDASGAIVVDLD